jgi:hypothetical protein
MKTPLGTYLKQRPNGRLFKPIPSRNQISNAFLSTSSRSAE